MDKSICEVAVSGEQPRRGKPMRYFGDDLAAVIELIALGVVIAMAIAATYDNDIPRGWKTLGALCALLALVLLPITTLRSLLTLRRSIGAESPLEQPRRVPWRQALILAVNIILVVMAITVMLLA